MSITVEKFGLAVGRMQRLLGGVTSDVLQGIHNPNFVTSDCTSWASSVCEDLRTQLDWIEARIKEPAVTGGDHHE